MADNYDAAKLEILEGLEAVRVRPGMYIGGTGNRGLHHILWEIIDNSMDEVTNGFGNEITIKLHDDDSVSVEDNGRGIPVDIHPKLKICGVEVVFTQLHAGGKFNNSNYNFSGGLHGVGASVTNALSRWLTVDIYKNGKHYHEEFHSPEENGKIKSGVVAKPLEVLGTANGKQGTTVRFLPDDRVFGKEKLNYDIINRKIRELAFLNKGVRLRLIDERVSINGGEIKDKTFQYNGGIADFVIYLNENKTKLYDEPIYLYNMVDKFEVQVAIQHTDTFVESVFSYVNNIPTTEGGTHETGFKAAFTKIMNDYARKKNLVKDKDPQLTGDDYREGMTAVLSIKMQNIQFEGQTKTKLGNPEARPKVEAAINATLEDYLNSHPKIAEIIINKALNAAKARESAKKAKDLVRQKNSIGAGSLVGKLSGCSGRKAEINELFIVEGDSAGGSAKQGRDRSFQAVLPLRGKPLNAEKKNLSQILANEEIRTIVHALGAGIDSDFNIADLKFNKVIILADADQDGAHIRAILATFFFRYMKELITDGHLFIGMPPLYKVEKGDYCKYCYDRADLDEAIAEAGRGYKVQRYKGLGEMNPEQLWETTINPATRSLIKVGIEDAANAEKMITVLMGDDIESRKQYINENANFNKEDEYEKYGG